MDKNILHHHIYTAGLSNAKCRYENAKHSIWIRKIVFTLSSNEFHSKRLSGKISDDNYDTCPDIVWLLKKEQNCERGVTYTLDSEVDGLE